MTFGPDWGWGATPKESEDMLSLYTDRGGNFLDTANVYTKGNSEKIIGDWIRRKVSRRSRLVIANKFFGTLYPGDPNAGGAGRKSIVAACENSLRRLQTDYIDLYWMHCWDKLTPIEETMRAVDDLVRAGKIRYAGFSDTPAWKTAQAQTTALFRGWSPLIALQVEYSLLERTVEGELIPMAQELGLGVTPWSPLKFGVLTGKYTRAARHKVKAGRGAWVEGSLNDHAYDVVDVLMKVAKEAHSTPARAALAWLRDQPGVTSIILGARTVEQLADNLAAIDLRLTAKQGEQLAEATKPSLDFPAGFIERAGSFSSGGTTINGVANPLTPMAPKKESEVY
jgi:aryl-alcohol dehydrogenase-like predicted oxidoreductase